MNTFLLFSLLRKISKIFKILVNYKLKIEDAASAQIKQKMQSRWCCLGIKDVRFFPTQEP